MFDYSQLVNDMKIEVRGVYNDSNTICLSIDENTELKLYDIFGTGNTINIQLDLKEELDKLGLNELVNKYVGSFIDESILHNINKEIYRFMEINKYEIYNKFQLILFSYNPMERYFY